MPSPFFFLSLSSPEISGLWLGPQELRPWKLGVLDGSGSQHRGPELAVLGAESFSSRQASPSTSPGEDFPAGVRGALSTGEQRTRPLSLCLFWGLKFPLRQGDG